MMALTLHQPWASLVAAGRKPIENRSWAPPKGLIGHDFAIHAGNTYDEEGATRIRDIAGIEAYSDLPFRTHGQILAVARLASVVTESTDRWFFGPFGWVLENIRELAMPVDCRGMHKLWALPIHIEAKIRGMLTRGEITVR